MQKIVEKLGWKLHWRLDKFRDPSDEISTLLQHGAPMTEILKRFADSYLGKTEWDGNVGLNEGLAELIDLGFGLGSPTAFDTTNGYLGVGDSSTGENASQTGLQAPTNKLYKIFDDTYPSRTGQTVEARATFGTDEANFAWEEYTIANGSSDSAVNLNRKTASKGTKASGETWTLSVSVTLS